jgi:UDP-N-acetylglucosamine--N-acetylmuramyl-(pentapeptide) pyrophosphoryl-undecaprenol N-acetylglucosamine transferase
MKNYKFIISGGGTGGHIYPAVAIANKLKEVFPSCEILFVGAKDKMEMQKVPQAGYKIEGLWISGIQRKLTLENIKFPLKLVSSLWKARNILKSFKPDFVIGTGGFASGPLLKMATWMKIPTLIQEQNSYPGITNKWLAKDVNAICVAYEGLDKFFPADKILITGNPVRQDLIHTDSKKTDAIAYFNLDASKKTLVILGGSLGSRRINELIADYHQIILDQNLQIIWQCGKLYIDKYKIFNEIPNIQVLAFVDRMDYLYACADFIISRAGASSVSELCIVAKPTIFIPSPNVAEDHQTHNAKAIVEKNGAIMIKEADLENTFKIEFLNLIQNEKKQDTFSKNMQKLAKPHATQHIVDKVIDLMP